MVGSRVLPNSQQDRLEISQQLAKKETVNVDIYPVPLYWMRHLFSSIKDHNVLNLPKSNDAAYSATFAVGSC